MRPIAISPLFALILIGCAGLDQARRMTAEQIAAKPDTWVCDRLASFAYLGRMPEAWATEATRRELTHCIDKGLDRRAEERTRAKQPIFCDRQDRSQDSRCW